MLVLKLLISLFVSVIVYWLYDYSFSELDPMCYMIANLSKIFIRNLYPLPVRESNSLDYSTTDLTNYRNMFSKAAQGPGIHEKSLYQVKRIVSITIENKLNIRLFIPHTSSKNDLISTILWFHGGGFILGGTAEDSLKCRILANTTSSIVASVEYRLAPENPYPAAIEDAELALAWLLTENSLKNYGGSNNNIIIAGESAGGNIAAALMASYIDKIGSHKSIIGLFLVYPVLDQHLYRQSAIQYRNTNGMLTLDQMIWFWKLYLQDHDATSCSTNFKICPINAPKNILSQFPNTLIVLAKYDVLYSEGIDFHNKLLELNVNSIDLTYNSTVHGFYGTPSNVAKKTNDDVAEVINNWKKTCV